MEEKTGIMAKLTDEDRAFYEACNATDFPYDRDATVVSLFRAQAKRTPDAVAVVYRDTRLTYAALDALTDRLAAHIGARGVGRGDVVSILIGRSEAMPVTALGVLKAGAAYQPLDPSYPAERLNFMMQDAKAKLLIAEEGLRPIVNEYGGDVLLTRDIPALPEGDIPEGPRPEDLFILLYTSGSTGVPKGCMLEHRNLVSFCAYYIDRFRLAPGCASAAYASFGFDASMMDTYPSLLSGAAMHIIPEEMRLQLDQIDAYFTANHVTHAFMTTQVGRQFAVEFPENPSLRYLLTGGETLTPLAPPKSYRFYNVYGPTECTILSTIFEVDRFYDNIPIGKPLGNMRFLILDEKGEMAPVGEEGELCLAGPQVSRGYLNRPEKTREAYRENPAADGADYETMYCTGDIVRLLPDGNLEFQGRRDTQVKVRGFRIELTEIEAVIREYPDISDATVIAKPAPAGGQMVLAYIVSPKKIDISALNAFIAKQKPPYMVPAGTMQIDAIPLNPNMKVDKKKLPEIRFDQLGEGGGKALSKMEEELSELVREVLGVERFPVDGQLAYAGLTSLSAITLAAAVLKKYGVAPDVKALLEDASILTIENAVVDALLAGGCAPAAEKNLLDQYPLTQTQLGIYLECMKPGGHEAYNIPLLCRLPEDVDEARLRAAVRSAIDCHPVFCAAVGTDENGEPCLRPRPLLDWTIETCETDGDEPPALTSFSFGEAPLFRVRLLRGPKRLRLLIETHHIIADGESVMALLGEIDRAYGGELLERESYTAFDLALDEAAARRTKKLDEARAYYESVFRGVSADSLPGADRFGGASRLADLRLAAGVSRAEARALCARLHITENAFFTAAFGLLLAKFSGSDEALFATIYNGRTDPRTFGLAGMLVKTLPVYVSTPAEKTAADYFTEVRTQLDRSKAHDLFSFAEIRRACGVTGDILFAYQGAMLSGLTLCGAPLDARQLKLSEVMAALSVEVWEDGGDGYEILVEYDGGRYSEALMQSFGAAYGVLLQSLLRAETLGGAALLSPGALAALQSIHDTAWPVPERPAYRLLQDSAAAWPERVAAIANGASMTYAALNAAANRMGRALCARGLAVGGIVGVMLPRGLDVYIARQGVLKAGGAFLPVDPEYPDDRVAYILRDSGARYLVTTKDVYEARRAAIEESGVIAVFVDAARDEAVSGDNLDLDVPYDGLAYCIYTSGSTGKPKGVMLTQKNLVNFVDANPKNHEILGYTERGRVSLALASITFDVSIMEEFIPLAHGLTICMANEEEIHNPLALRDLCMANGVDLMTCTPSFLTNLIDIPELAPALARIRAIDLGAESFPSGLYGKLRAVNPTVYIMNGYGPTEATISCTMKPIESDEHITIGIPNANVKVVMLDAQDCPLPVGALGEMAILGDGVGRGYIGRGDLTKKNFIRLWDMPAYKSGDLARLLPDGEIEFRGRTDHQVKLRGLRVELGEIEAAINTYPGVKSSVVVMKNNGSEDFLAGYFTAAAPVELKALAAHLSASLTRYMVPGVLTQLDAFPLTANGKIDRKRLPDVEYRAARRAAEPPANQTEEKLCAIFGEVLKLGQVGATDDFFELGGTSLSASRVALLAMNRGLPVVYGDVFQYPTPRRLAMRCIEGDADERETPAGGEIEAFDYGTLARALGENRMENVDAVQRKPLGNILLLGATGFLGIHVLKSFLEKESGQALCLIRKGARSSVESRLSTMLMYYFDDAYEKMLGSRVRCVDGDLTDIASLDRLDGGAFDTVINCAASVKHFAHDDSLERINVDGVRNLIALCRRLGKRLIQVSTVSVAGEGLGGAPGRDRLMSENELYFGQMLDNAYVHTKFMAERYVLSAVGEGLDAKIMRVGNLMSRSSDGEFQINFHTNAFMRSLRAYRALGVFPMSLMGTAAEFSPIDATAEAILALAGTDRRFTVFHPYNNHTIFMADVVAAMNRHGFPVRVVSDGEFAAALSDAARRPAKERAVSALLAYQGHGGEARYEIGAANAFTTEALYRLAYLWPVPGADYLDKSISMLDTLGFFDDFGE